MKAVVFDLDGTLLDTLQDIANACNAALTRHGFPTHPAAAYRYFVGDGVAALMSRAVPSGLDTPNILAKLVADYREEYHRHWNGLTRPYDGIPELLDELASRGLAMAVLSNKPDDFTKRCVAEFLPGARFSEVLGASPAFPTKPDPAGAWHIAATLNVAAAEILYVGDTATDMKTAAAAGMLPVGALWGFRNAGELRSSGARHLIEHPHDLLRLV